MHANEREFQANTLSGHPPFHRSLFLVLVLFFISLGHGGAEPGPLLMPGQSAPACELPRLADDTRQGFPVPGTWNLVFFWSLFCHTCIEEMPLIRDELAARPLPDHQSFFVALDSTRMRAAVGNFLRRRQLELPVLLEEIASDSYVAADQWGVRTTPAVFLVDPTGTVAFSAEGPFDHEELFAVMKTDAKNPSPGAASAPACSNGDKP
jgi:hypothetical protein